MKYMVLRFPDGKPKALTLSYDDGVRDDMKLAEIIGRYGIKCTFNHTGTEKMTKAEVEEYILSKGHEIAVHGANHRAEGRIRPIEGIRDVLDCRKCLEEKYGIIIRGMAYPDSGIRFFNGNATYEEIRSYLKKLDIAYARSAVGDNDRFELPEDWYAWTPTAHHKNPDLMQYIETFLSIDLSERNYMSTKDPRLFYLWGHSYEFEREKNWELLEEICEKLSRKPDIWYATNMEIYRYVSAYHALQYSADGQIVYNPTVHTVWFEIDGTPYSVRSDETVRLSL